MRRLVIGFAVAAMLPICHLVNAQDDADQLRVTERERLRSLVQGDMETARRLHSDDFQLVDPSGGTMSKEQYLGQIASGVLDYIIWEPETMAVRRYGDAAVIRYQAKAQAVFRGQETPLRRFWHTDVYERRGSTWQVVWSQATLIQ